MGGRVDLRGRCFPLAVLPAAGLAGVVQFGPLDGRGGLELDPGILAVAALLRDLRQRLPAAKLIVGQRENLRRILAGAAVPVRHAKANAQGVWPLCQAVRLLQRVHRISEIVGPRHPEHGHLALAQPDRRVPPTEPAGRFCRSQSLEIGKPNRILAQKTAAVDGHGEAKPGIDTRHNARQVAAPRDARDPDPLRIDSGQGPQEGMGQERVGDGMVGPLILGRFIDLVEAAPARRSAGGVPLPFAVGADGHAAAGIHGNGGIAAGVPQPDPGIEGRAAPAMHQDHPRHFAPRRSLRQAIVGKHTGGTLVPGQAFVEYRGHVLDQRGIGRISLGGVAEHFHVPARSGTRRRDALGCLLRPRAGNEADA